MLGRDLWKKVLPLVVGFGIAGCGGAMKDVKARAATDLSCAAEQIQVTEAGKDKWTAMGCGSTADCTKMGDAITCTKQAPPSTAPAGAPPAQ